MFSVFTATTCFEAQCLHSSKSPLIKEMDEKRHFNASSHTARRPFAHAPLFDTVVPARLWWEEEQSVILLSS